MHSEMIPLEKLEAYGESSARSLPIGGSVPGRESSSRILRSAHTLQRLQRRMTREGRDDGAARWLLDNWYLCEREALDAAAAFRGAPRIRRSGDTALVIAAAAALLSASRGNVDAARCAAFIRGFERKTVFTRQELALFAAALRAAAAEALCSLYRCKNADEAMAASLFGSLRLWGHTDFAALLEDVSRTEQILRADPSGVYPRIDEGSRDSYRQQLERLAARRGIPEYRVAQRALRMSSSASVQQERHIG